MLNEKMVYLKKENDELRNMLNLKKKKESYHVSYVTNHKIKDWFNKIEITTNPMQSDIPAIKETENFKELGTNIKLESSNLMDTKYLSLKTETYLHNTNFITKNLKVAFCGTTPN